MRRNGRMILVLFVSLLTIGIGTSLASEWDSEATPEAAFERLKTLVGTWESSRGEEVRFSLTADGSALIERFENMSSVYHMDGGELRATHYCGAKNQPRFKAASYDPARGTLAFDFIDVTNLSAPGAYHTSEIRIRFFDEDHIEIHFSGLDEGVETPATVELTRK